jgi:hypothetical protein
MLFGAPLRSAGNKHQLRSVLPAAHSKEASLQPSPNVRLGQRSEWWSKRRPKRHAVGHARPLMGHSVIQ